MASFKQYGAQLLGRALNARVVRKGKVGLLFEEDHLEAFFRHFGVDCVFDVGANLGQYARMLRNIGFSGPVISFEPVPELADVLRKRASNDQNWFIEETALDETIRRIEFNVTADSQFSSLHAPFKNDVDFYVMQAAGKSGPALHDLNKVVRQIEVSTSTLGDAYRRCKSKIGFERAYLKMDTQGNDLAIARGGDAVLTEFVGLQSELAIQKIYDSADDYLNAIDYFTSRGFILSAFIPNNVGHFPYLVEIDCVMFNGRFRR
jgi:FkbM family methyltransferase